MDEPRRQDDEVLEQSVSRGHELRDLNYRGVVLVGIALLLLTGLAMAITYGFAIWKTRGFEPRGENTQFESRQRENAAHPLFDDGAPAKQRLIREQQEAQQREQLASYGWVQSPNYARIPIDRAIDLLATGESQSLDTQPADNSENDTTENLDEGD